jgi:hypothetical protein
MRNKEKAKRKAVAAIGEIVRAAKELAKAEQAYYNRKPRKPTVLSEGGGDEN